MVMIRALKKLVTSRAALVMLVRKPKIRLNMGSASFPELGNRVLVTARPSAGSVPSAQDLCSVARAIEVHHSASASVDNRPCTTGGVDGHMSALVLGVRRLAEDPASLQRPLQRSTRVPVRIVGDMGRPILSIHLGANPSHRARRPRATHERFKFHCRSRRSPVQLSGANEVVDSVGPVGWQRVNSLPFESHRLRDGGALHVDETPGLGFNSPLECGARDEGPDQRAVEGCAAR